MVARYKTTLNSLQRYLKGGDVPLEEVDGTTIQGYEQWLKDSGLCRNTTSFYIRNLRTIYNHAVDDGLVISSSPFKHVYTGIDKTVKRALPLEIIKQLKELDLSLNPVWSLQGICSCSVSIPVGCRSSIWHNLHQAICMAVRSFTAVRRPHNSCTSNGNLPCRR